jgi:hypothetical protein
MVDSIGALGTKLDAAHLDAVWIHEHLETIRNRMASAQDAVVLQGHLNALQLICDEMLDAHKVLFDYLMRLEAELEAKRRDPGW